MSISFDDIVAGLDDVKVWTTPAAQAALDQVLAATGGVLSRRDAAMLSERTGVSVRSFYRWSASDERVPDPAAYATFVDAVTALGPSGFFFDDVALTSLYLCGGNMARFREEVVAAGYPMPSPSTLSRLWRSTVSAAVREGARTGQRNRYRNLFYVRHSASMVDEAWQLDAFSLDVRVLLSATLNDGDGEVVADADAFVAYRPQLLLLQDDHSRFIVAWALLDHEPTAADTLALLADAYEARPAEDGSGIVIGGPTERLVCDNAGAFRAAAVEEVLVGFGSQLSPTPAYSPPAKGKIERVGQTIQSMVVTGLAGVVTEAQRWDTSHALEVDARHWLTYELLEARVAAAVWSYNYDRVHSGLGTTPFECYSSRPGPRGSVPDELLARHYLPVGHAGGRRRVQPVGVCVFGDYWLDPNMDPGLIGTDVYVRSLHHRLDRLAVFTSDEPDAEFISMVRRSTALTDDDRGRLMADRIEASRSIARHSRAARRGLEVRTGRIAAGEGDASMFDAAVEVNRTSEQPAAPEAEPDDAVDADDAVDVAEPEEAPAPVKQRGKKRKPSPKPTSRPAKQNNSTTGVPAQQPTHNGTDLAAMEAALDAEIDKGHQ